MRMVTINAETPLGWGWTNSVHQKGEYLRVKTPEGLEK